MRLTRRKELTRRQFGATLATAAGGGVLLARRAGAQDQGVIELCVAQMVGGLNLTLTNKVAGLNQFLLGFRSLNDYLWVKGWHPYLTQQLVSEGRVSLAYDGVVGVPDGSRLLGIGIHPTLVSIVTQPSVAYMRRVDGEEVTGVLNWVEQHGTYAANTAVIETVNTVTWNVYETEQNQTPGNTTPPPVQPRPPEVDQLCAGLANSQLYTDVGVAWGCFVTSLAPGIGLGYCASWMALWTFVRVANWYYDCAP